MNILENISVDSIFIRTFLVPDANSLLSDFVQIPVHRIYGPDPQFVQFGPFESGYDITVTLTTCADLRYIADMNLLVELVAAPTLGSPVQIGAEEGFKLTGIIPPPSPDKELYVYTFKTQKPNNQPFKKRTYV
jgi:hypothetical protein